MYYYAVDFLGYWPVGAVALVKAKDIEDARTIFWENLPEALGKTNNDNTIGIQRIFEDFTMLLDGNY